LAEIQAARSSRPEALPADAAGADEPELPEEAGRVGSGVEGRLGVRACRVKIERKRLRIGHTTGAKFRLGNKYKRPMY